MHSSIVPNTLSTMRCEPLESSRAIRSKAEWMRALKIGALGLDVVHGAALGHALLLGPQGQVQKQGCVRQLVCGGPAA